MYRQGDLLFVKIDNLPKHVGKQRNNILAKGEFTGHMHQLMGGDVYNEPKKKKKYAHVTDDGVVIHEEHKPVKLEKGTYEVVRQREYKPARRRTQAVID